MNTGRIGKLKRAFTDGGEFLLPRQDKTDVKTIIAGSRTLTDPGIMQDVITSSGFIITEVVSGGAPGVDTLAERWTDKNGFLSRDFRQTGNDMAGVPGPIRNAEMSDYAEALIAVWDGRSRRTRNMIRRARKHGLQVFVYRVDEAGEAIEARERLQVLVSGGCEAGRYSGGGTEKGSE